MAGSVLLSGDRDGVRLLTLNRPDRRNALDSALTEALVAAMEKAAAEDTVRAIVLTGAEPAFSAGTDIKEFDDSERGREALAKRSAAFRDLLTMIGALPVPVIAAVNGFALGGGCALAIACDMAIAAESASFGYPEIRHGLTAEGVVPMLVRQAGRKAAFEMIATGRAFSPEEALRLGLINRVVADEALVDQAMALGAMFAGYSAAALARMKGILQAVADLPVEEGIAHVDGLKGR